MSQQQDLGEECVSVFSCTYLEDERSIFIFEKALLYRWQEKGNETLSCSASGIRIRCAYIHTHIRKYIQQVDKNQYRQRWF